MVGNQGWHVMKRLALLLLVGAVSSAARGEAVPMVDVPAMISESDYVFVAREAGRPHGDATRRLIVLRDIKGDALPGAAVEAQVFVRDASVALYFLRKSGERLISTNSYHGVYPASEALRIHEGSQQDAESRVAVELVNALATPQDDLLETAPRHGYVASPDDVGPAHLSVFFVFADIAEALLSVRAQAQRAALREVLLGSPVASARIWAAAALMGIDDPSGIAPIAAMLRAPPGDANPDAWTYFGSAMDVMVARETPLAPALVAPVGELAAAPDARVREAALSWLGREQVASAVPLMVKGLWDPDLHVRYKAVEALSFTQKDYSHAVAADRYERHESDYLDYWRQWAQREKIGSTGDR